MLCLAVLNSPAGADDWSPYKPLPLSTVPLPEVNDPEWTQNPVDTFVRAKLVERELPPAPEADRRTWLRRVTYDLIGLPPTPEDLTEFLADPRPDAIAYAEVVDRLLASPHYGERWARHWLDVVRYADTDGFAIDSERHSLWRYRDYVIRHFNQDRPYDQFVREQLAGDELAGPVSDENSLADPTAIIATSFYRLGPYEADNMVPENRQQDFLNEMTTTIGTAFLGLTVGCARCHDHKYDPIPQEDFYRMQAFLKPAQRGETPAEFLPDELLSGVQEQKLRAETELAKRQEAWATHRQTLKEQLATALGKQPVDVEDAVFTKALAGEKIPLPVVTKSDTESQKPSEETTAGGSDTEDESAAQAEETPMFEFAAESRAQHDALKKAVDDFADHKRFASSVNTITKPKGEEAEIPVTYVLLGGDVFAEGRAVEPGGLSAIEPWCDEISAQVETAAQQIQGRRKALAEWIASPENPLTARVYVNRIWQYHFGSGIVRTANDFGINGSGPSHPELLDFLAQYFLDQGQRTKPLHRLLVLSRTYRASSQHPDWQVCAETDPENRLLWRAPWRRLEAEAIRDALLAVSGRLNTERGGPGFYEELPDGLPAEYPFFRWEPSEETQRQRRSIYMFLRRNLTHPLMEAFDIADSSQSCEQRSRSVTPSQALSLFNGKLVAEASRHLTQRLLEQPSDSPDDSIRKLFVLALSREPDPEELAACSASLAAKAERYKAMQTAYQDEGKNAEVKQESGDDSPRSEETSEATSDAESLLNDPHMLAFRDLCLVILNANEFVFLD